MTKKPLINALAAILYITLVAFTMSYVGNTVDQEDSFVAPIAFISIFTLSAAIMGYILLYQPLQLYLGDDKKGGVKLFLQTVGIFAVLTLLVLIIAFI